MSATPFSKNRETERGPQSTRHARAKRSERRVSRGSDHETVTRTGDDHERMAQAPHSRNASWYGGNELPAGRAGLRLGEERLSLGSGARV
jgi:hypothetical protein